jgi:AraC family transcriptional regulator of adaptative response/methylated-DNA-[protein]-cysteine methyltransferase
MLGHVLVAATGRGICEVAFGDDPARLLGALQQRFPQAAFIGTDAVFDGWLAQVLATMDLPRASCGLPLDLRGTAFQHSVWQALCAIPAGCTASYQQVAERIGRSGAARAVARACASNMLALLVPCHRVVREDGGLGGYRWGLERKRRLLDRERG